jgi:exodeoxyribonuclease V alpha subunit
VTATIDKLATAGVFGPLDVHFARMLAEIDPSAKPAVLLGAAWASRAIAFGHVCADLRRITLRPPVDADGNEIVGIDSPSLFEWVMALAGNATLVGDGTTRKPLVFDGDARLYLFRYHRYERMLAEALRSRASQTIDIDLGLARSTLDRLFTGGTGFQLDVRQREAAAVAALRHLTVLSGGPGTGKTTTVVRMLALVQSLQLARGLPPLRIALAAPTGKAAARLGESIGTQIAALQCDDDVKAAIPRAASTIHRLLGVRGGSSTRFVHDASLPLATDVVVVDEASMVDLATMAKLVDAVPASARIVLVGDKHQLASVEAGAILGDICDAGRQGGAPRSAAFASTLSQLVDAPARPNEAPAAIADCLVDLVQSHRFDTDSAIGGLAEAIKHGRSDEAVTRLQAAIGNTRGQLGMVPVGEGDELPTVLRSIVLDGYRPVVDAKDPAERLALLGRFRLLSPHRRGPFGVERLNALVEQLLGLGARMHAGTPWYDGRPILVTTNDHQLGLFNGDVGVVCSDDNGKLRAWFMGGDGALRSFAPSRLPEVETVFAMTVHKSQGSEFDRVGLLVPRQLSSLLTRELLYTAVTRARERVTLFGAARAIADAIGKRIERASGLRDALWGR